jgi:hypothetical protein
MGQKIQLFLFFPLVLLKSNRKYVTIKKEERIMEKHTSRGTVLVETLVAIGMLVLVLPAFISNQILYSRSSLSNIYLTKAAFLLEEGVEVVKLLRGAGWDTEINSLTVGEEYYLSFDGATWTTTLTPTLIDNNFKQTIVLEDVYRDENSEIASTGILDSNTKKLTATVSWTDRGKVSTKHIVTYISNISNQP